MKKPKRTKGDVAHAAVQTIVSSLPIVSGPASALFSSIFTPPIEKRRDAWIEFIAEDVNRLAQAFDEITPEALSRNESYVTTLLEATQIAMRNHEEEKIEALRNAVTNSALPDAPEENLQRIFLNYIAELTPWHLAVLSFFDDPKLWAQREGVELPHLYTVRMAVLLEWAFPDLGGKEDIHGQLLRTLENHGLFAMDSEDRANGSVGMLRPRVTPLGKRFLAFIQKPLTDMGAAPSA